jgi:hypothetical protein
VRLAFAAALIAALPAIAEAQERPLVFPTRDVTVIYRLSVPGRPAMEMTRQWGAQSRIERRTMPGEADYMIVDQPNQRAFIIMEQARAIREIPFAQVSGAQRMLESARFTRGGAERIAGHDCTVWRFEFQGQSGDACVTADGVLLRSLGNSPGREVRAEAVNVVYGPVDPTLFRQPEGYQTMPAPQ